MTLDPQLAEGRGTYCLAELSTGSLEYAEYTSLDQFRDDLSILQPSEVLVSAKHLDTTAWNEFTRAVGIPIACAAGMKPPVARTQLPKFVRDRIT